MGSAAFVEAALTALGQTLVLPPADPLGGKETPAPAVVVLRGYDFPKDTPGRLAEYLRRGGKVLVLGPLDETVAASLGLKPVPPNSAAARPSLVAPVAGLTPGAPNRVRQNPSVVTLYEADGAERLASWLVEDGTDTGQPAAIAFANGIALGWEPQPLDGVRMGQFLISLIGRIDPDALKAAADAASASVGKVGRFASMADSFAFLQNACGEHPGIRGPLDEAVARNGDALRAIQQQSWAEGLAAAADAALAFQTAYATSFSSRSCEVRAVWCQTLPSAGQWGPLLQALANAGVNALFLGTSTPAMAAYPSQVVPASPRVTPGDDPLQAGLDLAPRFDVDLHAWHSVMALGDITPEQVEELAKAHRIQTDPSGKRQPWLCPSHGENLELNKRIIAELLGRYPLRGIVLDYVRYGGAGACYCPSCRESFAREIGAEQITDWPRCVTQGPLRQRYAEFRNAQIGRIVAALARAAKEARPTAVVSVTIAPSPLDSAFGQSDWPSWLQSGDIDVIIPMNYDADAQALRTLVEGQVRSADGRAEVCASIWARTPPGASPDPTRILDLAAAARLGGATGFAVRQVGPELLHEQLQLLGCGIGQLAAVPPYDGPRTRFVLLDEPVPRTHPKTYGEGDVIRATIDAGPGVPFETLRPGIENAETGEVHSLRAPEAGPEGGAQVTFRGVQGTYRIVARFVGLPGVPDGAVRHSSLFSVVPPAQIAEFRQAEERAGRIDVAIFEKGAGARSIAGFLNGQSGAMAAELVADLKPETLSRFDILIITDPEEPQAVFTPDIAEAIQSFMGQMGGGVLLLHDACGLGGTPVLFAPVGSPLKGGARSTARQVVTLETEHPALEGLPRTQPFKPAFENHVMLLRGVEGVPIIGHPDAGTKPDQGTVVVGELDRGRVALCGLAIGQAGTPDQRREAPPSHQEAAILLNLVRWLAGAPAGSTPSPAPQPGGALPQPAPEGPPGMPQNSGGAVGNLPPRPGEAGGNR